MYFMHGGGMVFGDRFTTMAWCFAWVKQLDVVLISIELTKALENTVPKVEGCMAGPKCVAEHHSEIGVDPERIVVTGAWVELHGWPGAWYVFDVFAPARRWGSVP
jgi:acetyl esterase/lipase